MKSVYTDKSHHKDLFRVSKTTELCDKNSLDAFNLKLIKYNNCMGNSSSSLEWRLKPLGSIPVGYLVSALLMSFLDLSLSLNTRLHSHNSPDAYKTMSDDHHFT